MMIQRRSGFLLIFFLLLIISIPMGFTETSDLEIGWILPVVSEITGEAFQLNGKSAGAFFQSFKLDQTDGLIHVTIVSDNFKFQGSYTPALRVVQSEFVFTNQDLINYLGHDERITVWDGTSRINVKYFLNGRLKSEKSFSDKGIVDSDIILFYLQGMLSKKAGDFQCELFGKKDGLTVNASFRLTATSDFIKLAPEYTYPEGLRRISDRKNEVWVYVMELKGIPRLFYGYKFYYVFEKTEPYRLVAYWGGPLKEAEYGYSQ